jgi:hypothetical protein
MPVQAELALHLVGGALIILQQPIADSGTAVFAHLGCDASGTEFAGKMRRRDK